MLPHSTLNTGITPNDGLGDGLRTNMRKLIANDVALQASIDQISFSISGFVGVSMINAPGGVAGLTNAGLLINEVIPDIAISKVNGLESILDRDIASIAITGDTNKILTLTKFDGSVIQESFTDIDTDTDVFLNGLNFNSTNGTFTAVLNDTVTSSVNLDGRWSLIGHGHVWNDITGVENVALKNANNFWSTNQTFSGLVSANSGVNIIGKSSFSYNETTNMIRPVSMALNYIATPTNLITSSVDYHGVDIVGSSVSSNEGMHLASLYPFESTALWGGSGTIGGLYAAYLQTNNNASGTVNLAVGLRLLHQNNNGGTTQNYQGIRIENPNKTNGTINNIYQLYIEDPTTSNGNKWGVYSLAQNNYLKSLVLGNPTAPISNETGLVIYSEGESSDVAKITLKNRDLSVMQNQVLSTIDFFSSENDGNHISAFIRNVGKETYGRKGSISIGVATTNATDAVEVANFDENGDFNVNKKIRSNIINTNGLTFATLPPSPEQGDRTYITDATNVSYGSVAAGGGNIIAPVFYDGFQWVYR